jgi:hypothetical protein
MWVIFGVIFAQTGFFAAFITQPQTSSNKSGSCPMADPMRRSGKPCGQEKFNTGDAGTPVLGACWGLWTGRRIQTFR